MKDFVKMVLAVLCGLFVAGIVGFFLFFGFIGALAAAGSSSQPVLPRSGVLLMDMSKMTVGEQSTGDNPMAALSALRGGGVPQTIGLWQAVQAINAAADDASVKYIFLKTDGAAAGISQLQELRTSLANFRASGKPVIAYTESPSTGSYYLASVADKVFMTSNEGATTMITGISSQLIFLKDLLDKLGVNVQLIRHGKYKSAGEMFIRNSSSPENMEQNQVMINSIWNSYASDIAQSRGLSVEQVNAAINDLKLNLATDFLAEGFVDELLTRSELQARLADLAVEKSYKDVNFIAFPDYVAAKVLPDLKAKKKVAIIYAEGDIVDGTAKQNVAGDRFASMIAKVRADSTVKAVVLRVNSPGGSVLASDKIKTEIDLTIKDKPVVASFGDYAASGGYWISNSCEKIFSNATTLTGSIGVFSMIPDFSKVARNVAHVTITPVNSNEHGDMFSLMRPFDDKERAYMQGSVEHIYETFVNVVAEGRGLEPDYVDSIAQGRVWAGSDALRIGLVDEIGTLEDAIRWTVSLVDEDASKVAVEEYPKPQTTAEMLLAAFGQESDESLLALVSSRRSVAAEFDGTPFEGVAHAAEDWAKMWKKGHHEVMFARLPYAIDIR